VYLARKVENKDEKVAVKVMKKEFLKSGDNAKKSIVSEIKILEQIKHENIVSIQDYGDNGIISKPSGSQKENLVFLVLEYAPGGLLFEICEDLGLLGENNARVFFKEIVTAVDFMHK
jgi:serine/threonine protein kinase